MTARTYAIRTINGKRLKVTVEADVYQAYLDEGKDAVAEVRAAVAKSERLPAQCLEIKDVTEIPET